MLCVKPFCGSAVCAVLWYEPAVCVVLWCAILIAVCTDLVVVVVVVAVCSLADCCWVVLVVVVVRRADCCWPLCDMSRAVLARAAACWVFLQMPSSTYVGHLSGSWPGVVRAFPSHGVGVAASSASYEVTSQGVGVVSSPQEEMGVVMRLKVRDVRLRTSWSASSNPEPPSLEASLT